MAVEMERTRLRELTHTVGCCRTTWHLCRNGAYPIKGIDTCYRSIIIIHKYVEMERTRLRELTPYFNAISVDNSVSRNGAYPIKGIDTSKDSGSEQRFLGRNGAYPIKGIDTKPLQYIQASSQQ